MSETITITSDVEKDFEFQPGRKVTARLVFPEGTPQEIKSNIQSAHLQYIGAYAARSKERIDSNDKKKLLQFRQPCDCSTNRITISNKSYFRL